MKEKWLEFAHRVGDIQIRIIFTILYFILFVPAGLALLVFKDLLETKTFPKWSDFDSKNISIKNLKEQ